MIPTRAHLLSLLDGILGLPAFAGLDSIDVSVRVPNGAVVRVLTDWSSSPVTERPMQYAEVSVSEENGTTYYKARGRTAREALRAVRLKIAKEAA